MDRRVEIFERLLELTTEQNAHLDANRFVELLQAQQEKDKLVAELKTLGTVNYRQSVLLGDLRDKILENDGALALKVESMMCDLGDKLGKIRDGARAAKAYR